MSELKEYCTIQLYIKKTNNSLYQLLEDTCTTHLFSFRYVTFLMPNSTLLNKMKKEKPSVAAKMIKSLLLKGVFKNSSELKGDVSSIIGKLTNPSSLKVKLDPKFIQWTGYDNLSILLYEGNDVPSYTELLRPVKKITEKNIIINKKPESKKPESKKPESKKPESKKPVNKSKK